MMKTHKTFKDAVLGSLDEEGLFSYLERDGKTYLFYNGGEIISEDKTS